MVSAHLGPAVWKSPEDFHFGLSKADAGKQLKEFRKTNHLDLEDDVLERCLVNAFVESRCQVTLGLPLDGNDDMWKGSGMQFMNDGSQSDPAVASKCETDAFQVGFAIGRVRKSEELFNRYSLTHQMKKVPKATNKALEALTLEDTAGLNEGIVVNMDERELRAHLNLLEKTDEKSHPRRLGSKLAALKWTIKTELSEREELVASTPAARSTENESEEDDDSIHQKSRSRDGVSYVAILKDGSNNTETLRVKRDSSLASVACNVFDRFSFKKNEWMQLMHHPEDPQDEEEEKDGRGVDLRDTIEDLLTDEDKEQSSGEVTVTFSARSGRVCSKSIKKGTKMVCVGFRDEFNGTPDEECCLWQLVAETVTVGEVSKSYLSSFAECEFAGKVHHRDDNGRKIYPNKGSALSTITTARIVELVVPLMMAGEAGDVIKPCEFDS